MEINDPQWFYDLQEAPVQMLETRKTEVIAADSEEEILERILELEDLLTEDKQRKGQIPKTKAPACVGNQELKKTE